MKIALIQPPLTQLNTPYPAVPTLYGFLKSQGIEVTQHDFSIQLIERLFCKEGLKRVQCELKNSVSTSSSVQFFRSNFQSYLECVDPVMDFLRGTDTSLALQIQRRSFLPEGPRFNSLTDEDLEQSFGPMGVTDLSKHLASLFLDDIADVIREGIDPLFEFSKYGEKLAASQTRFTPLYDTLIQRSKKPSIIDQILNELTDTLIETEKPDLIGLSVPFPGNVYSALRIGHRIGARAKRVLGGGYANTELRNLSDGRIFDFIDFITLDDGEGPLLCLTEYLSSKKKSDQLIRTFFREGSTVRYVNASARSEMSFGERPAPSYLGLPLHRYLSLFEMQNPVNRLWTEHRWNKLTLAHGCYWKKCTFCDTSLSYIRDYQPDRPEKILSKMKQIQNETGWRGFHFVDEAAPPALLKGLSKLLVEDQYKITWWGNIRFEKTFSAELALQMAESGCVAVTGGLEVASPRLLKLINKGVTLEQVAQVTRNFADAGIYVHAYLMYGFPTQTTQETVDSLEVVRQLFAEGCIHSGFWHRFSATVHSPVGQDPNKFNIGLQSAPPPPEGVFSQNDLAYTDPTGTPHDELGQGLRIALYNYMLGVGLNHTVNSWFSISTPKTKISKRFVASALKNRINR